MDKVFPGAVVGVVFTDGRKKVVPVGRFTYEYNSPVVEGNSIFDLASMTKSIPGACSLLSLIDAGLLNLEDKLVDFVPEFGNFENKQQVTIRHILTYTLDLDLPPMSGHLKNATAAELFETVVKAPLKSPPGFRYQYVNATASFIPLIVKKVTGKTLDVFAEEKFFSTLGMSRTTFYPEKFEKTECVPTEVDDWRGRTIQGEVHDESSFILKQAGYVTAISGLFSTALDLLKFLEMLLNRGCKDGQRYFSESIIKQMHTNQLGSNINDQAGLGWEMNWPVGLGTICGPKTFYKTGFTGTLVAIDPDRGVAFTLLTNRIYPKRPKDSLAINGVRRDIANIVFGNA